MLFEGKEVREALTRYCTQNKLIHETYKNCFVLDETLHRELYGSKAAGEFAIGAKIPREQLVDRLMEKGCSPFYALIREGSEEPMGIKKGKCTGILVQREKIMGTKSVVKVFGAD
jgi:hypothetical protein